MSVTRSLQRRPSSGVPHSTSLTGTYAGVVSRSCSRSDFVWRPAPLSLLEVEAQWITQVWIEHSGKVFDTARLLRPKYPLSLSFVLSVCRESDIERTIAKSGLRSALEPRLGCDELWIDFVYPNGSRRATPPSLIQHRPGQFLRLLPIQLSGTGWRHLVSIGCIGVVPGAKATGSPGGVWKRKRSETMENVGAILRSNGLGFDDVFKCNCDLRIWLNAVHSTKCTLRTSNRLICLLAPLTARMDWHWGLRSGWNAGPLAHKQ